MTIEEILNLEWDDVNAMDMDTLRGTVKFVRDKANRRYRTTSKAVGRTSKGDSLSQAVQGLEESGGLISLRQADRNQLLKEFRRGRNFLAAKTSTVTGTKQVKAAMLSRLGVSESDLSNDDISNIWSAYYRMSEAADLSKSQQVAIFGSSNVLMQRVFQIARERKRGGQSVDAESLSEYLIEKDIAAQAYEAVSELFEDGLEELL